MNRIPFYIIDDEHEKELFKNSLIFFDTSSLLDFYYFTEENIEELETKLFKSLEKRLWITYQTQIEFFKNKDKVKLKPLETYNSLIQKVKGNSESGHIEEIENVITATKSNISDELRGHLKTLQEKVSKNNKHPYLKDFNFSDINSQVHDIEKKILEFKVQFESFKKLITEEIESQKNKFKDETNDIILPILEKYFNSTNEPNIKEINSIIKDGEFRYRNQIPPGYLDKDDKIGFQKYGDLIVWKEILKKSKENHSNVILVINDLKEDWWYLDDKKKNISPRYELIKEFKDYTGNNFWMYEISNFLYKANLYFSTSIDSETIEEIKNITDENHSNELDQIFVEWIFEYLNVDALQQLINLNEKENNYLCFYKDEKIDVKHIKITSHIYTKLMMPIRDFLNDDYEDDDCEKRVLLLEYDDLEKLSRFDNHISTKKTLRTLLKKCDINKRIIVTINIGGEYRKYFDSMD